MRHFLQLLAEKFMKMPKHGSLLQKMRAFSRNEPLFVAEKFIQTPKHRWFFVLFHNFFLKSSSKCKDMVVCSKSCKVLANRWFSFFFTKWGPFCNFFLKSSSKCKDMVVCSKSCKVLAKSMTKWATFCNLLLKSSSKHQNMVLCSRSCIVLAKSMSSWNEAVLQLFAEKFIETSKHGSVFKKLQVLTKSMIFRAFSRNEPLFPTFSLKVHRNAKTW